MSTNGTGFSSVATAQMRLKAKIIGLVPVPKREMEDCRLAAAAKKMNQMFLPTS